MVRSVSILNRNKESQERYWSQRAERVVLAGEKSAEEMTADLAKLYEETQKAIQKEIEAFYGRYSRDVGVSLEEARKALSKSELKSYYEQTQAYYDAIAETGYAFDPAYRQRLHRQLSLKSAVSRLEALQADCQFQVEKLYAQEQDAFRAGLGATYEDAYYRAMFNLQQGLGFGSPFSALNTRVIEKAVQERWSGENYSDRIWTNKDKLTLVLQQTIPQGIAAGQNPRIIGKIIHDRMFGQGAAKGRGGMLWRSISLARTEFNHITNSAMWDTYVESGVVEQYQFLATLDGCTTDSCQSLDLKIFKLSEKMEGINYPPISSPPHPCRSTTIPYFEPDEIDAMFDDAATRIARDPLTGKNYYVPANLAYKDWYNQYVLPQSEWNGIIGLTTSTGSVVENVKSHFFDRSAERSVSAAEAKDALINSLHVTDVKYNERNEPSVQYIGGKATVSFNPETNTVITAWQTGRDKLKRYGGKTT